MTSTTRADGHARVLAEPSKIERATVYVSVGDIDAVFGKIQRGGGRMVMPKTELAGGMGWIAGFTDPAGNSIGLWMPGKKVAAPKRKSAAKKVGGATKKTTARRTASPAKKVGAKASAKKVTGAKKKENKNKR